MKEYHGLLRRVLADGDPQFNERTGQLMIVSAGDQSVYNLEDGFPAVTTKSVSIRWAAEEFFWMLRGETNAKTLYDKGGIDIWNKNAFQHYLKRKGLDKKIPKNTLIWNKEFEKYQEGMKSSDWNMEDSEMGPIYGKQWRDWRDQKGKKVDQLQNILQGIKDNPGSRYHLQTAWNPSELSKMALAPCHILSQFTITNNQDLDLHMFQRSADVFLGVPFNMNQYGLFNHVVANDSDLNPRKFIHSFGNVHIYGGLPPRSEFLKENLRELQKRVKEVKTLEGYLEVKEWYLKTMGPESEGNERKDHVPFILEQLSKEPRERPKLEIKKAPLLELIEEPVKGNIKLIDYKPHKWDSKASMAA